MEESRHEDNYDMPSSYHQDPLGVSNHVVMVPDPLSGINHVVMVPDPLCGSNHVVMVHDVFWGPTDNLTN